MNTNRRNKLDSIIDQIFDDGASDMEQLSSELAESKTEELIDDGEIKESDRDYVSRKLSILFYHWSSPRGTYDEEVTV